MIKFQIAYKNKPEENELSFEIMEATDIIQALIMFDNRHSNATVFCVLRCGKSI